MRFAPPAPAVLDSRDLPCTRCGALVRVWEAPAGCVDAASFVGGCCLVPVRVPVPFNEFPAGYGETAA